MMRTLALTEGKLLLREPLAFFWGLAFPMALLAVMGLTSSNINGVPLVTVYEPIVIAFSSVAFGIQGLPLQIAGYRERRILRRLATTPAGRVRVVGAQLIVDLVVILVAIAGILAVGRLAFGVALPSQFAGFLLVAVLEVTSMLGLGLLIGALAPTARTAGAAGTVLFFPLMYFAGLWSPQMSPRLQHIGEFTPLGAAVQGLRATMAGQWPGGVQIAILAACTLVTATAAVRFFRWD
jgi:ABC-2 type transport system permease protein